MKQIIKKKPPSEIMEHGIQYTLVGDYYFPACLLTDEKPASGRWATMYERYLQEKHPYEYARLLWDGELAALLESVQADCEARLELLIGQMAEAEGVTEPLKQGNQLMWVQRMNSIRSRAEEMIIHEML